jgi:polyhydroxyalkanoate synthase subunit PhaC
MNFYEQIDQARRWQGEVMDAFGLGPEETPSREVLSGPAFTLKTFGDAHHGGPALLIVPASIKRAYIWDLAPQVSVVQECLQNAVSVYLIQWERPGPDEQNLGLDAYADASILSALDAIKAETGEVRVFLAGHSIGGTFAAIFTSLHDLRVAGLVLIGAPLSFGPDRGALDAVVSQAPRADELTRFLGNVPGAFLSTMSILASYRSFQNERLEDWFNSLEDIQSLQTHLMVERWTLDEMPQPKKLFEQVLEDLYRRNLFMRGELAVDGKRATPASVHAPLLSVVDERSDVVTPESSLLFHDAVKSTDKKVLWYGGDVGVALQHVGMLVGRNAHRCLWPEIMKWVQAHHSGG